MKLDASVIVSIITLVSSITGIIIANRYTARSAREAQARAVEIERTKVDADAYRRAKEQYDTALSEQERRIMRLRAEIEEDRQEYDKDIAEMRDRLNHLEEDRTRDRERIRELTLNLRQLADWGRELCEDLRMRGIAYQDPPFDIGLP